MLLLVHITVHLPQGQVHEQPKSLKSQLQGWFLFPSADSTPPQALLLWVGGDQCCRELCNQGTDQGPLSVCACHPLPLPKILHMRTQGISIQAENFSILLVGVMEQRLFLCYKQNLNFRTYSSLSHLFVVLDNCTGHQALLLGFPQAPHPLSLHPCPQRDRSNMYI